MRIVLRPNGKKEVGGKLYQEHVEIASDCGDYRPPWAVVPSVLFWKSGDEELYRRLIEGETVTVELVPEEPCATR